MPWSTGPRRPKQRALSPSDPRTPSRRTIYGITPREQDAIKAAQGNRCPGCLRTNPGPDGWALDHDHSHEACNGRGCRKCVGGILCQPDNKVLAFARDDPATLERLAAYLRAQRIPR